MRWRSLAGKSFDAVSTKTYDKNVMSSATVTFLSDPRPLASGIVPTPAGRRHPSGPGQGGDRLAAVHDQDGPGDERSAGRTQEQGRPGDVLRPAPPAQRDRLQD